MIENGVFLVLFDGKDKEGEQLLQFSFDGCIQRIEKYGFSGFGLGKYQCAHTERHEMLLIGDFWASFCVADVNVCVRVGVWAFGSLEVCVLCVGRRKEYDGLFAFSTDRPIPTHFFFLSPTRIPIC